MNENSGTNTTGFERESDETDELQNLSTIKKSPFRKYDDRASKREVQVPFISEIDSYIEEKGLEVRNQDINNKRLQQEIRELREQKNILDLRITNLKRKESASLIYLDWYKDLKQVLFDQYRIKLEEEINSFVNAVNDFKYYGYNAHHIVKEYKQIESLRFEIKSMQGIVKSIVKTRDETLKR